MTRLKFFFIALLLILLFVDVSMESGGKESTSPSPVAQPVTVSTVVSTVTDDNFKAEVVKSKLPVLVDFFATWCVPCRIYSVAVNQVAEEYQGRLKVVRIDVDQSPKLYRNTQSQVIPISYLFKKGKAVDKWEGALSKDELEGELQKVLALKPPSPKNNL